VLTSILSPEAEGCGQPAAISDIYTLRVCGRKTTVAEYSVVKESAAALAGFGASGSPS
jgi:hypothetical protein